MKKGFSLIVPVYNETDRLLLGVSEMLTVLLKQKDAWELLLVDDGSAYPIESVIKKHSALYARFRTLKSQKKMKVIALPTNSGKGAAIGAGVNESVYSDILFSDVDCSVPLSMITPFRAALKRADVVIASRRLPTSQIMVHQPFVREAAGRVYTFLSNSLYGLGVTDATCGLKAFRGSVAKTVFDLHRIHRWAFDTEILFLARKRHYTIEEVPVVWSNKIGSRVKFIDTTKAFTDLFTIRINDLKGLYL